MLTGASINGIMLAQTAVTLEKNTVTKPRSVGVVTENTLVLTQ
jgi:hypothetical protein